MSADLPVTLRIVNVTDVYKLQNFPSLRTLINAKRAELEASHGGPERAKLVSILTGDFLAPYLLSALDNGQGMVRMLNECPIDIVIFGNHEDDIPHEQVVKRSAEYKGVWINSNMTDHEAFKLGYQVDRHVIEVGDGDQRRKVGFVGVLSDSPGLYRSNAFGGATIDDPYATLERYKAKLEQEDGVDLVVPLCHLYVPQDLVTCRTFDFPVVLSGHDHHVVNEVFDGTLLLKAGSDAKHAVVLDITWPSAARDCRPQLAVEVVRVGDYAPDAALSSVVRSASAVLEHLRHTELARIPPDFRPLTSANSRGQLCSMARYLWTCLRRQINVEAGTEAAVDAVLISGGDLRGDRAYADEAVFTLEDLNEEISAKLKYVVALMPGWLLSDGVRCAHALGPNPGYTQVDDGVRIDPHSGAVTHVAGAPIDLQRSYRVVLTRWDVRDGPVRPWIDYYAAHPDHVSTDDWKAQVTLLAHFAQHVWARLWQHLDVNRDGALAPSEVLALDTDGDGRVSRREVAAALRNIGVDVDDEEMSFVDCIMRAAGDRNSDGYLSSDEIADLIPPKI